MTAQSPLLPRAKKQKPITFCKYGYSFELGKLNSMWGCRTNYLDDLAGVVVMSFLILDEIIDTFNPVYTYVRLSLLIGSLVLITPAYGPCKTNDKLL